MTDRYEETLDALAHEIWAAAQLAPGEGVVDGVARIVALLREEAHPVIAACDPDTIRELLVALKKVAQSLDWYAHGRCRGFDDGAPLPTGEAVELAKRTIAKVTPDRDL